MDLNNAIVTHVEWKLKFRSAIATQAQMDIVSISKDTCCELGKWLHGEGGSKFGFFPETVNCIKKHAVFHQEAGKVATAINEKKYDDAGVMLNAGKPYAKASNDVGFAIKRLKIKASL